MNYYVLSAIQSDDSPISLVEDAVLYTNKEEINEELEYGKLPWYSYKTSKICDFPTEGVLVLKNKYKKNFFRNINDNIYVVNYLFKELLKNKINTNFFEIEVVDEGGEKIDENKYFIFRFNFFLDYVNAIDINKSTYKFNEDYLILEKAYLLEGLNENIFKINDIDPAQDTFFISETFKSEIEKIEHSGIKIDDVSMAKWQDSDDFTFMLLDENEVNEYVLPI